MLPNVWREDRSETSSPFIQHNHTSQIYDNNPQILPRQNPYTGQQFNQNGQGYIQYAPNPDQNSQYLYPPTHPNYPPPPNLSQHPPPLFHHHSAPQPDITEVLSQLTAGMAQLSVGHRELFASLNNLNSRMNTHQPLGPAIPTVDQVTEGLGGIDLGRQQAPHLNRSHISLPIHSATPRDIRPSYAPPPVMPSRISSPSEGAYARDPNRGQVFREPRIRENIRFSGDAKLLRQFLLDIYDVLDQYSLEFTSDKRRINWIASHFNSTTSDSTPAQSWFSALLMKNAYSHGITDQYANLKALDYVIEPHLSTDRFISEMILVFGDKTSAKTARAALDKCKQGSTSIVEYNLRFGPLSFQV